MVKLIGSPAMEYALLAHGDQKYGRKPYSVHLLDVVTVARRFFDYEDLTQDFVDALWLHDVVEDTVRPNEYQTLQEARDEEFEALAYTLHPFGAGDPVASKKTTALVRAVTNALGPDKRTRNLLTYSAIRDEPGAILVKLCDRIANVENACSFQRHGRRPGKIFAKYLAGFPLFEDELHGRCRGENATAEALWTHLRKVYGDGLSRLSTEHVEKLPQAALDMF